MYARNILEPDTVNAIENELITLSARIDVATHRVLTLIRDADERKLGEYWGYGSTANWLSHRIGMSPGVSRERIRVARALGTLPRIDEAFSRGLLSFSKVRAELERVIRGLRQVRAQEMPKEKPIERYVLLPRAIFEFLLENGDRFAVIESTAAVERDSEPIWVLAHAIDLDRLRAVDAERIDRREEAVVSTDPVVNLHVLAGLVTRSIPLPTIGRKTA